MSNIVQTQATSFKKELYEAIHNLSTDVLKIALYTANADLNESTTVYSTSNEVVGTGYVSGGVAMTGAANQFFWGTRRTLICRCSVWCGGYRPLRTDLQQQQSQSRNCRAGLWV
jgi:hypothetical protein